MYWLLDFGLVIYVVGIGDYGILYKIKLLVLWFLMCFIVKSIYFELFYVSKDFFVIFGYYVYVLGFFFNFFFCLSRKNLVFGNGKFFLCIEVGSRSYYGG